MVIHCGRKILKLSEREIVERLSSRAKSGDLLPRGYQKIDSLEVVVPKKDEAILEEIPEFTLD